MNPAAGQGILIEIPGEDGEFRSKVVEVHGGALWIELPLHMKSNMPAQLSDDQLVVKYRVPSGALIKYPANFIESKDDPGRIWSITAPSADAVSRLQQRQYVRVPAGLSVRLDHMFSGTNKIVDVHSRDISGGGMAVLLPKGIYLETGSFVTARFTLPSNDFPVEVVCQVIRVSDRNEYGFAIASLKYNNIKEPIRQKIIQYTFVRQRALR